MSETVNPPPAKRIRLSKDDLRQLSKEDLICRWLEQETYLDTLEEVVQDQETLGLINEVATLRQSEAATGSQLTEVQNRENIMVLKLTAKEQEVHEYRNHLQLLKTSATPSVTQLKSLLLDPAVNLMFQRMKTEVKEAKKKAEEAQDDLAAWKFTSDSQTGKRLMARCRSLLQENESIGKMIASGRVAKIEGELALERRLVEEMKSGQAELDEFIAELDEDVEGMQSTIYLLQQQLRETRDQVTKLKEDNETLQSASGNCHHSNDKTSKTELKEQTAPISNHIKEEIEDAKNFPSINISTTVGGDNLSELLSPGAEENLVTLTVKDSERLEFDEEFEEEEMDVEQGKATKANSNTNGGKNNRYDVPYGNGSLSKRTLSPDDNDIEGKKGATNGTAVGHAKDTGRGRSSANQSPSKKQRGGSASQSRTAKGQRNSGGETEEDQDFGNGRDDRSTGGRGGSSKSPRNSTRPGSQTRATRGSAMMNGDLTENGMDCS